MTDLHARIAELAAKATPGDWAHRGWGDGTTEAGLTNVFNDDAEVLLMEYLPECDAALIVTLRNAVPEILTALRIAERVMDEDWLAAAVFKAVTNQFGFIDCGDFARAIIAALKEPT